MAGSIDHLSDSEVEELRKTFYSQAYEILENVQDSLLKLEAEPGNRDIIKELQRYFHTLKGDSNSIGLIHVGVLCHKVEDILTLLKEGKRQADSGAVGLVLSCVDRIMNILNTNESGENENTIKDISDAIDSFLSSAKPVPGSNRPSAGRNIFTEYEMLQARDAISQGMKLYNIGIAFHPLCTEKSIAIFRIGQRLNGIGRIISSHPDIYKDKTPNPEMFFAILSSDADPDEMMEKISIAGITGRIDIKPFDTDRPGPHCQVNSDPGLQAPDAPARNPATEPLTQKQKSDTLRVETSRVDKIMDLVGELIIGKSIIEQIASDLEEGIFVQDASARLIAANNLMERIVSDLRKGAMHMRMVPINHAFRKFPKTVRDLSAEMGKLVRLEISGREAELDKGIVDALTEPLAHIIRNMIDHGIEKPEYRRSTGKFEEGVITLKAYHEASQIVIEVSDDGSGIDLGKLKRKAVEKGILSADGADRLSDVAAVNLIFISGLSASDTVTDISGRGVGMEVVKSTIEGMKGSVEVETVPSKGTRFRLRLPLTLAVIKALLFEVDSTLYSIPISAVAEVTRVTKGDLTTVDGKDTLILRDHLISIIRLGELFSTNNTGGDKKFTVILSIGSKRVGFLVDRLIGQRELVIKAVDSRYTQTDVLSGASILGNGRVVLILDVPAIFKKAIEEENLRDPRA